MNSEDVYKTEFDVLVVGSGASGGWACKRLAEAGLKIALLDAGPPQSDKNFNEHMPVFELKYRNAAPEVIRRTRPMQSQFYDCTEYNYEWYCNDLDEPYTTAAGLPFTWGGRLRIGGGRTNVWGRASLRYSDLDFKAASHDGFGEDWPLGYRDLAPYYDLVEKYIGVTGSAEGLPQLPDGSFQPAMGLTCSEVLVRERIKAKLGWTLTLARSANLTRPLNGRPPCHYCGPCERGCVTHSYFNSSFTTVADALKTGNCDYIPNAMVYKVLMDPQRNRARGILYVDRPTRRLREVRGRVVVLGAQCLESVRILLNSATRQQPNGLGNSSGALGHYLMDHAAGGRASGEFHDLWEQPNRNGPNRPIGIYIPRFRNLISAPQSKEFLRGYALAGGGSVDFNWNAPGFGMAYKHSLHLPVNTFSVDALAEVLPRADHYVEIDSNVVDTYGIPVLRFHMKRQENDVALLRDAAQSAAEILEVSGAKNIKTWVEPTPPGKIRHEVGVARMGANPKTSVLNQFQQCHDVKNLFVVDAAGFPSNPCQNPTLSIMALAVRSCDYLMERMKSGSI
jgi:choline dehydrogenase-like flavoprotein